MSEDFWSKEFSASDFQAEIEKLQREGRMPSLEQFLSVIAEVRDEFAPRFWKRGNVLTENTPEALTQLRDAQLLEQLNALCVPMIESVAKVTQCQTVILMGLCNAVYALVTRMPRSFWVIGGYKTIRPISEAVIQKSCS